MKVGDLLNLEDCTSTWGLEGGFVGYAHEPCVAVATVHPFGLNNDVLVINAAGAVVLLDSKDVKRSGEIDVASG